MLSIIYGSSIPQRDTPKLEPDIQRANLVSTILQLKAMGTNNLLGFDLWTRPLVRLFVEVAPQFFKVADANKINKRKKQEKIEPPYNKYEKPDEWRLLKVKTSARSVSHSFQHGPLCAYDFLSESNVWLMLFHLLSQSCIIHIVPIVYNAHSPSKELLDCLIVRTAAGH